MPVEIPLTRGYVALVDEVDAERLLRFKWRVSVRETHRNYAARHGGEGDPLTVGMHRDILPPPKGMHVDHIDGNGLNNQRSNLRLATPAQNNANSNLRNRQARNKHGYWGVAYISNGCNYRGRLTIGRVQIYTKGFATPIEAAIAWDELALKHYGEFATLNFPDLRAAA